MGGSSPHTTLLNQIKNFVLTDEVDVRMLHNTLKRQVNIWWEVLSFCVLTMSKWFQTPICGGEPGDEGSRPFGRSEAIH